MKGCAVPLSLKEETRRQPPHPYPDPTYGPSSATAHFGPRETTGAVALAVIGKRICSATARCAVPEARQPGRWLACGLPSKPGIRRRYKPDLPLEETAGASGWADRRPASLLPIARWASTRKLAPPLRHGRFRHASNFFPKGLSRPPHELTT